LHDALARAIITITVDKPWLIVIHTASFFIASIRAIGKIYSRAEKLVTKQMMNG
jgi:hypothetical protein